MIRQQALCCQTSSIYLYVSKHNKMCATFYYTVEYSKIY